VSVHWCFPLSVFLLHLFLNFVRPGFVFTRAGIGAGNEVEGDPGNGIPCKYPISSASRNPTNDGSRANPGNTASGDQAAATALTGMLPRSSFDLPQTVCYLLDLYSHSLIGVMSGELAPCPQEAVFIEPSSDGSDEDSPARWAASFSSGASP
jgi:hypothetical protein